MTTAPTTEATFKNEFASKTAARNAATPAGVPVRMVQTPAEFSEDGTPGYSLRMDTRSRQLPADLIAALAEGGASVEYLKHDTTAHRHVWLLYVPTTTVVV